MSEWCVDICNQAQQNLYLQCNFPKDNQRKSRIVY